MPRLLSDSTVKFSFLRDRIGERTALGHAAQNPYYTSPERRSASENWRRVSVYSVCFSAERNVAPTPEQQVRAEIDCLRDGGGRLVADIGRTDDRGSILTQVPLVPRRMTSRDAP